MMNTLQSVFQFIEEHPATITILLFMLGTYIVNRKEFYDNKPYISVVPEFEKRVLDWNDKGTPTVEEGNIKYISIANLGKSVAIDLIIDFLYERVLENPYKKEDISISGKYRMKYLPPSSHKNYCRRGYIRSIPSEMYPEKVKISYKFRGKIYEETYFLHSKNVDERFEELSELK